MSFSKDVSGLRSAALATTLLTALCGSALAQSQVFEFDLPEQSLSKALLAYAQISGQDVIFQDQIVSGHSIPALHGSYSADEALHHILRGTKLRIERTASGTLVISDTLSDQSNALFDQNRRLVKGDAAFRSRENEVQVAQAQGQIAQDSGTGTQSSNMAELEQIIVTGSRIARSDFEAPTPVSTVSTDSLQLSNPISIGSALVEMPQLVGSTTIGSSSRIGIQTTPGNFLQLRNLGSIRTLVLVDGKRVPPTTYDGTVDIDTIPELLVSRVDVVTGGASAVYGSDAVTGVVNYILDTDFVGTKAVAQSGLSEYGDNFNYKAGAATGFELGSKAHVLVSAEYFHTDGFLNSDRDYWGHCAAAGTVIGVGNPGTTSNPLEMSCDDLRTTSYAHPFLVRPETGPLSNIVFTTPGNYRAFDRGTPTGSPGLYKGGDLGWLDMEDASNADDTDRVSAFGRVSYDVNDSISAYASVNATKLKIHDYNVTNYSTTRLEIFSGNPYLPPELQQILTDAGTTQFRMLHHYHELPRIESFKNLFTSTFAVGLKGEFQGFDWDLSYQHARSEQKTTTTNIIENSHFAAAVDAVRDPVSGNIVCNVQLNPDPAIRAKYANCSPLNPFGYGALSDAAAAYITENDLIYKPRNIFDNVSLAITGELFSLPAGPVSVAFGGEWREESLRFTSNADPNVPVDKTGLRAFPATNVRFYLTNPAQAIGDQGVLEGFGEIDVPLLANQPYAQSLDINAAIRLTDYRTSGLVTTWKLGGSWSPVDSFRLRGSVSRDIRAPALYDLNLQNEQISGGATDPKTGRTGNVQVLQGGNINLRPEIAKTWAIGAVIEPSFIDDLTLSVDYYNIKIRDAIAVPTTESVLEICELSGGTSPVCANITRPGPFNDTSPSNFPTLIQITRTNLSGFWNSGLDFNATYQTDLWDGTLTTSLYATYLLSDKSQRTILDPIIDEKGVLDPRFKATATFNYRFGDYGINITERMLGSIGKYSSTQEFVTPPTKPVFYTNATFTWDIHPYDTNTQVFFNMTNVFGADAPLIVTSFATGSGVHTRGDIYASSIVGRTFSLGARVNF